MQHEGWNIIRINLGRVTRGHHRAQVEQLVAWLPTDRSVAREWGGVGRGTPPDAVWISSRFSPEDPDFVFTFHPGHIEYAGDDPSTLDFGYLRPGHRMTAQIEATCQKVARDILKKHKESKASEMVRKEEGGT